MTSTTIINAVAEHYHVRPEALSMKSRRRAITLARHVAMHITREATSLSLEQIGKAFKRDHSTVMHALGRIEGLMNTDERVYFAVKNIKAQLESAGNNASDGARLSGSHTTTQPAPNHTKGVTK